jgi:hypothetical protein
MALDFLGDEMPPGYEAWQCHICNAVCNFEAMTQCQKAECGFDRDQPESNGGAFGFMRLLVANSTKN